MSLESVIPSSEDPTLSEQDKGTDTGVSDVTDLDIPVYIPEQLTTEEKADVSERWETLRESLTWKDVILHPVARLSIFYHEGILKQADQEYEEWKAEENTLRAEMESADSSIQKSSSVRESLYAAQAMAGIELNSKKYNETKRQEALGKVDTYQQKRRENLEFVSAKVRSIEEKKKKYEDERDLAKKVFIDSYVAKVDAEEVLATEYAAEITTAENEKNACMKRADELAASREFLESFTPAELLSYDADELQETIRQLAYKERQFIAQAEQYDVEANVLNEKRIATVSKKLLWEARISPKKTSETSSEILAPDGPAKEQVADGSTNQQKESPATPSAPVAEAKRTIPVPETVTPESGVVDEVRIPEAAIATPDSGTEKAEVRPGSIFEAIGGIRKEYKEISPEERSDFDTTFETVQRVYEKKYPESNMMKWLKWLMKFLFKPEEKTSKASQE